MTKAKHLSLWQRLWHKDWTKPLACIKLAAGTVGVFATNIGHQLDNPKFQAILDKLEVPGYVLLACAVLVWFASTHDSTE